MRLWSLSPHYLDSQGLVALWREALLAQKVLAGQTRGYRHHPQLVRFRECANPSGAIATYLRGVAEEAERRGYRFNRELIARRSFRGRIAVTGGQVAYELEWLRGKLRQRDPGRFAQFQDVKIARLHPLFHRVRGPVAPWEVR